MGHVANTSLEIAYFKLYLDISFLNNLKANFVQIYDVNEFSENKSDLSINLSLQIFLSVRFIVKMYIIPR